MGGKQSKTFIDYFQEYKTNDLKKWKTIPEKNQQDKKQYIIVEKTKSLDENTNKIIINQKYAEIEEMNKKPEFTRDDTHIQKFKDFVKLVYPDFEYTGGGQNHYSIENYTAIYNILKEDVYDEDKNRHRNDLCDIRNHAAKAGHHLIRKDRKSELMEQIDNFHAMGNHHYVPPPSCGNEIRGGTNYERRGADALAQSSASRGGQYFGY
jgi:hypothetical protein